MKTHEEIIIHNNLKILLNELPTGQHYRFNGSGRLVDKRQSSNRAPDQNGQSDISRSSNTDDDVAASTEPARSDWQTRRARRHQSTTHEESAEQTPGSAFIKPDQRNPWIKDRLGNALLSTILHLQLPNFVSCGRDKPSPMTQNLVTVGAKF